MEPFRPACSLFSECIWLGSPDANVRSGIWKGFPGPAATLIRRPPGFARFNATGLATVPGREQPSIRRRSDPRQLQAVQHVRTCIAPTGQHTARGLADTVRGELSG